MTQKETAKILLDIKAVTLKQNDAYTWTSGIKAPIYCDNRMIISFPRERKKIIEFFLKTIKNLNIKVDVVAGTATAGITWAAWIADRLGKPMIYVRGEKKGHGRQNQIEGKFDKGQVVLVIEDLVSTGGSSFAAVEAIREAGGIVNNCIAIFTYEMEKAKNIFGNGNVTLTTLSNFSTLVETAFESEYIDIENKEKIIEWSKDPVNWGKKMGF